MDPIEDVCVFKGETAYIRCVEPLAKPAPKLQWLIGGQTFTDPRVDQSDWTLEISNVNLGDTGVYTCMAMGVKNRTADAQLTVYGKYIFMVYYLFHCIHCKYCY